MLQAIRNKATGWFALALISLVLFTMLFFGVGDYLTTRVDTYVAKVGEDEISQNDFQQRFRDWQASMRQQMGEGYDPRLFEQPGLKRQMLDRLIDEKLLEQANARMGLVVPASRLQSEIMSIPAFQVAGQYSPEAYRNYLQARRMSPEAFDDELRTGIGVQLIPVAVQDSAIVGASEVDAYLRLSEQTRSFRFVRVGEPAEPVSEEIGDEELQKYYDDNVASFMKPETVTVEYVEIDAASIPVPGEPSETDLKERYEQEKSRFGAPERRLASHILVRPTTSDAEAQKTALAKAEELVAKARAEGAEFAALARENSDDIGSREQGGDLGWIDTGLTDPAFEEALFAMEPGKISDPVHTDDGYHIIQLREVQQATYKPFEEVREQLITEFAQTERERLYGERSGELIDLVYKEPGDLKPTAEALGIEIKTAGPFTRDSGEGVFANPDAREMAFSDPVLVEGIVSDPVDLGDNRMVAIKMKDHKPSEPKPLTEVAAEVRTRILAQRRSEAVKARAEALYERVRGGETLETVAETMDAEIESADAIGRTSATPERALVNEAFRMPRPSADSPSRQLVQTGSDYAIVELSAVVDGDLAKVTEARREQVRSELAQSRAAAEGRALLAALRENTEIVVAEDRLQ
jgi:peptidyl-prolyl cis-trans isomerase D